MFAYVVDETKRLPRTNKTLSFYGNYIRLGEFIDTIRSLSGYLQHLGIGKGDNVILCLGNIPDAILSFYAINDTGAVANIVHPLIPSKALKKIADDMNTKAFILFDEFYEKYEWLRDSDKPVILCAASDYLPPLYKIPYEMYSYRFKKHVKYDDRVVKFKKILGKYPHKETDIKGDDIAAVLRENQRLLC